MVYGVKNCLLLFGNRTKQERRYHFEMTNHLGLMPLVKKTRTLFWEYNFKKKRRESEKIHSTHVWSKRKTKVNFFYCIGLMIWSCFNLFPCKDKHFSKLETTSGFHLVSQKQSMESKLMLLLNGAIFYVLFEFLIFFFLAFSKYGIWLLLIYHITQKPLSFGNARGFMTPHMILLE